MKHEAPMREALRLAACAAAQDEAPVGALILRDSLRLGEGFNQNAYLSDPTAHAEITALREAGNYLSNYRLGNAVLYVNLEPCLMCFTAMIHARITTLVYGADDPKTGFTQFLDAEKLTRLNHRIEIVSGVLAEESSALIKGFFKEKRERGKRKWMKNLNN